MNFDFDQDVWGLWERIHNIFHAGLKASLKVMASGDPDGTRKIVLDCLGRLGEIGYLDLGMEKERNSSVLVSAQEMLAHQDASLFLTVEVSARLFGRLLSRYGGDRLKAAILGDLKKGGLIGTIALSEKGMNIEGHPLETAGHPDGDGFRVTGRKETVINAPIADWIAVAGKVGDAQAVFLIQKENQGLSLGSNITKLGYEGVSASSLVLENCFVPSDRVIGPFDHDGLLQDVRLWEDQIRSSRPPRWA